MLSNAAESEKAASNVGADGSEVSNSTISDFQAKLCKALKSIKVDNSSEKFTEQDLQDLRAVLEKEFSGEYVDKLMNIFSKFTPDASPDKQLEGVVRKECTVIWVDGF